MCAVRNDRLRDGGGASGANPTRIEERRETFGRCEIELRQRPTEALGRTGKGSEKGAGGEQRAAPHQLLFADSIGEEAEVADADQAGRQHMEHKTPDELDCIQSQGLGPGAIRVVFPVKAPLQSSACTPIAVFRRQPAQIFRERMAETEIKTRLRARFSPRFLAPDRGPGSDARKNRYADVRLGAS